MIQKRGDPCEYCPGRVRPGHTRVDLRKGNHLVVFQDVPADVCDRCGAAYFSAEVTDRLQKAVRRGIRSRKNIKVPVVKFESVA
ncbi:MAG: type II toxin-antitoxin system MqsA family antitoxin [Planctomycetes bacterium]|nr:type II toxin-antitoxin system MqsA family antitoxin [Planctomycetota bacterium]